jgi:hypothetical protein
MTNSFNNIALSTLHSNKELEILVRSRSNMIENTMESISESNVEKYQALILPQINATQNSQQIIRRTFIQWRILLITKKGKLIWFESKSKSAPDAYKLNQLSNAINQLSFESDRKVETALSQIEYAHDIKFLKGNFLDHNLWPIDFWHRDEIIYTNFTSTNIQDLNHQRDLIYQRIKEDLSEGLKVFVKSLNPVVFESISNRNTVDFRLYNFIVAEHSVHQRNRQQAIHSYPFLAKSIMTDAYSQIRQVIDYGQPLSEALATHFAVSPALIRKLGSKPLPSISGPRSQPEFLFPLLAMLPLEKIPNSDNDWINFHKTINHLAEFIDQPINSPLGKAILIECLSSPSARDIVLSPDWVNSQQSAKHFIRAIFFVTRFLYRTTDSAIDADKNAHSAITHIISHLGIKKIIRCAQKWDLAYREAESYFASSNSYLQGTHWPTLLPDSITIDGFVITPLANVDSLATEGEDMNNCAATYAVECSRGICQLWSLRSDNKNNDLHRATMQTFLDSTSHGIKLIVRLGEVEGYDNTPASKESKVIADKLISLLNNQSESLKTYHQWQISRVNKSLSDRLEIATTRTLYLALQKSIQSRFDILDFWGNILKLTGFQDRLNELDSFSIVKTH